VVTSIINPVSEQGFELIAEAVLKAARPGGVVSTTKTLWVGIPVMMSCLPLMSL
jgi:hypothetical protein